MQQVAPSILSADFAFLADSCKKVLTPNSPMLHFDVMDGVFVPNISFGIPVLKSLKQALPEAKYDVHLMIQKPNNYVKHFAQSGADFITFHLEADGNPLETAKAIRSLGCKAGISIKPRTPAQEVFSLLNAVDMVLVMSVEPGFGGQSFMPSALSKISLIREETQKQGLDTLIEVDGGIDSTTGPECIKAGVDILVAGSAVFGAEDPVTAVNSILGK